MEGFTSINVSVKRNPFCQTMQKTEGTVCEKCYAKRIYSGQEKRYSENTDKFLCENFVPEYINRAIVRIHSFGELYNKLHFQNILKLVRFNPHCQFTMWTKRVDIVAAVLKDEEKPSNLILICSSTYLNVEGLLPEHFSKVFTVFGRKIINAPVINCEKQCNTCMKCYTATDGTTFINEREK